MKSNKIINFKSYGQQLQLSGGEEQEEGAARDAIGLKSTGSRKVGGPMGGRWEDGLIQSSVPAITRILRNLNQMLTTANNRQATSNQQPTSDNQRATSRGSNLCCTFDQLLEQTHTRPAAGWAGKAGGVAPGSAAGRTSQAFDEQKVADCKSKSNLPYGCHSLQIVRAQNLTMTQTQTLAGLQQQQ